MKLSIILIFIISLGSFNSSAQEMKKVTVDEGRNLNETLPVKEIYLYLAFENGQVYFKEGLSATAKLNYNLLVDEIKFIDPKGDTLGLANENTIKFIAIKTDTFFYNNGYVKQICGNALVKLAIQQKLKEAGKEKMGGYGQPTSTSAVTNYETIRDKTGQVKSLLVKEDIIYIKQNRYFLGDSVNNFFAFNKKNLLKMFSNNEKDVKKYLKNNPIDFNNAEDLQTLTVFLGTLKN